MNTSRSTFFRSFLLTAFFLLLLSGAFAAGYFVRDRSSIDNRFPIFDRVYSILLKRGLKEIPAPPALEYGMIRGMLEAYNDRYTFFVEPVQHELETNRLQGSYGGIGVRLGNDAQGNWVLFPYPDSSAQKAGILEGDRLLKVGDLEVTPATARDTILSEIRGEIGTTVAIIVGRPPDYAPIQIGVKREETPIPSVFPHLDVDEPAVGVLVINLIAASTADEIQRAVQDLQSRGAQYFILDLRNNPGGLLTAGVDIARLFLKDGTIMEQQYRGEAKKSYQVEKPGPLTDLSIAVLINENSASAAEIVAGALKANRRAVLVGSHSFGKDTVQFVFDLQDGSSLHITAAKWWVPGLEPGVGEGGIQPDVLVPPAEDEPASGTVDAALQAAVRELLTASAEP